MSNWPKIQREDEKEKVRQGEWVKEDFEPFTQWSISIEYSDQILKFDFITVKLS